MICGRCYGRKYCCIQEIKCYNVGFGDSYLCKNLCNDAKMLVDCGTRNSVPDDDIIEDIYKELSQTYFRSRSVMISHLHNDHYSGIKKLLNNYPDLKIGEVYLPNYISKGNLEFYAAMLFCKRYDNELSKLARFVLTIPGIFRRNLASHSRIRFLEEGKIVYSDLCRLETILPRRAKNRMCPVSYDVIDEFCSKYRRIFSSSYNDNDREDYDNNYRLVIQEGNEAFERLDSLVEEYSNETLELGEAVFADFKEKFMAHHNEMSLAFHELGVADDNNVLFFGDATKADVEYACAKYSRTHYGFVKTPHHGTKTHFVSTLPAARYYAISNCNGEKFCNSKITALYDVQYGDKSSFVCTNNGNCEIKTNGCICKSKKENYAVCGFEKYYTVTL